MESKYKIYLICYYNEHPINFLLPVYNEKQFANVKEIAGTCFKIQDNHDVEVVLACYKNDDIHLARINIESACKTNSNISFSILVNENENTAYLRAFTDALHNDFYPIPIDFMKNARIFS